MPNTEQSIEQTGGVPVVEVEVDVFGMMMYPTDKTLSVDGMPADAKATGDALDSVDEQIADILLDIKDLQEETGADIPLNGDSGAPTIAEAIANVFSNLYPVGSVYVTSATSLPSVISSIGTWVQIAMPLRLVDIKKGSRTYVEVDESYEASNLYMWLRTE